MDGLVGADCEPAARRAFVGVIADPETDGMAGADCGGGVAAR